MDISAFDTYIIEGECFFIHLYERNNTMNSAIISNCRLISPGVDLAGAYILIENGKVAQVSASPIAKPGVPVIDGSGLTAMPGFVDVHCHGRNNFDFCDGSEEGVEVMAKNKLAEGVTTLLPTTLTLPEEELAAGRAKLPKVE